MSSQRAAHSADKFLDVFLNHCSQNNVDATSEVINKFRDASNFNEQMELYQNLFKIGDMEAELLVDELKDKVANNNSYKLIPETSIKQQYVSYLLNKKIEICPN